MASVAVFVIAFSVGCLTGIAVKLLSRVGSAIEWPLTADGDLAVRLLLAASHR